MSLVVIIIIAFAIMSLLMVAQFILSKLKNWAWGAIIPIIIILSAVYSFFFTKINFQFRTFLHFAIPFFWSLEIWETGRNKLKKQKE
ncbi:hypothetical protein [Clostridium estertheticum]|uniref:hypothetical protein n=1 Tax=Clostridium estertheticum TaxID=238834 RepID=UPI001CF3F26A|nr:hypothetical protein [Clostridium estertheticum]MCB2339029.1 hypothetical protein [Clostridium estertheticum]